MENSENKNTEPFAENIFTSGTDTSPSLLGGFCPGCKKYYYPEPTYCPACLGALQNRPVGNSGTIYSFTRVRTPSGIGLPTPYGIGYVDLEKSGLRVLGLFDPESIDRLEIGAGVRLSVKELGMDSHGQPQLRPCFTVKKAELKPG